MARVLVAGAGAIGQWLGARLERAGHGVTLLSSPRHVAASSAAPLRITGHTNLEASLTFVADAKDLLGQPKFDAILLTSKAHRTQTVAPQVAPLLASDGAFVSLQNGLGNAEKLAHFVPAGRIALALTSHGLTLERPGLIHHAGIGATLVGPGPSGSPDVAARAAALLADAGLEPERQAAMRGFVWRKALINHALNPVAALHGATNGEVLERTELHGLAATLLREGVALATRGRIPLPPGDLAALLDATLRKTSANKVSMLQDVAARRATEIETLSGRMVRLAEKLLVSMPRSEAVYGRVKALEASYLGDEGARQTMWEELRWEQEPF